MNLIASQDGEWMVVFVPIVIVIGIASLVWRSGRKKSVIEQWALREGVRLLHYEERWLARGPFFLTTAKGQVVYRITVEYPDGRVATGWARGGAWMVGLLSDAVEVRWDKEKPHVPGFSVLMRDEQRTSEDKDSDDAGQ